MRHSLPPVTFLTGPSHPGGLQISSSTRLQDQVSLAQHYAQQGDSQNAAQILGQLAALGPEAGMGRGLADQVRDLQGTILGTGTFNGTRAEFLANQFVDQVMDPASLGAMLGASSVYQLGRLGWLRVLSAGTGSLGRAQGFLASGLAFGLEAPSFVLFHNLAANALGHGVDWSPAGLRQQVRSSFMVLGGLKAFGLLGRQASHLLGIQGGLGAASFHQGAMYLGILSGHVGEHALAGGSQTLGSQLFLESLVTLLHFNAMGRVLGAMTGARPRLAAPSQPEHRSRPHAFGYPALATLARSSGESGRRTSPATPQGPTILMMSGSGKAPRASRTSSLHSEIPLSRSLREKLKHLEEELTPQEIFEDLLDFRCQTHLVTQYRFQIPESAFLEFLLERHPQVFGEEVLQDPHMRAAIRVTHGVDSLRALQLPTRPQRLLAEAGVETLRQLVLRIERNDLQEIEGFGPRWEHLTQEALKAFLGFNQLLSRMHTYEGIRNHLAHPPVAAEIQQMREAALRELQAKGARDGQTEGEEWILNVAAAGDGEYFRRSTAAEAEGTLRVQADYQNNVLRLDDATFMMLESLAFHPGTSPFPRHWAMAILGLADAPIRSGHRDSLIAAASLTPPPSPNIQRTMEILAASMEKVERMSKPRLPEYNPVERVYGSTKVQVDVGSGVRRVNRILKQMRLEDLEQLRNLARERAQQPWFIAGISDGMGLATSAALIASGMMRHGVGVFYEPPALIKKASPVHMARLANVEGLRVFAEKCGVQLSIHYTDMVLSRWGHPQGDREFPQEILDSLASARDASPTPDLNFINSIAFARWISPAPGMPRLTQVPSVTIDGRVTLMDMKPYQERGYQGTLDSMGRNHGALLAGLQHFFGPESQSYFFTWAGGSQNIRGLKGIYGRGALGEAKVIGEQAALQFHLRSQEQDFARGVHKVVRYPDFISFALFGIPGGGAFGLIARDVLETRGFYQSVPQLAPRTFIEALTVTNLQHPLAQIEFDQPETTVMGAIVARMEEFNRRVENHVGEHPEWDLKKPLDLETSARLLQGLVHPDYLEQLPRVGD